MGKTIGIIALKGGVGKTSTVAALGASLAQDFNKKVLVVDGNFSAPNLGLHLGYVKPDRTIHDVLSGKVAMKDAIYSTDHGFHIVAGSLLGKGVDPLKLQEKIAEVKDEYDVVLVDSSPALNDEIAAVMKSSDELYAVTTPDYPTLSCTMRALKLAKQRKTQVHGLILNKVRSKNFELTLDEIEETADASIVAVVPDEMHVLSALAETTPSTIFKQNSDSTAEYRKLAASLIGETYTDGRFKSRLQKLFSKGPLKQDINRDLLRQR